MSDTKPPPLSAEPEKKPPPSALTGEDGASPPPTAAAAAKPGETTMIEALQAVETLTSLFGFDWDIATQAVEAVGTDITAASNYILDGGLAPDKGGAVYPIDNCPHVKSHVFITPEQLNSIDPIKSPCDHFLQKDMKSKSKSNQKSTGEDDDEVRRPARAKSDVNEDGSCPAGENWLCLQCGVVRCSRYVNGHGVAHWKDTCTTVGEGKDEGHCIAASFADLSVWCYVCEAYLKNKSLEPIVKVLEEKKFGLSESNVSVSRDGPPIPSEPHPKRVKSTNNLEDGDSSPASPTIPEDVTENEEDKDEEEAFRITQNARGLPFDFSEEMDVGNFTVDYAFGDAMPSNLEEVAKFITSDKCRRIMILAGAGMSVPAGIPDFRSRDGLYATMDADLLSATSQEKDVIKLDPSAALDQELFLMNPLPCLEINRSFLLGTKNQRWKATLAHRFIELLHAKTNKLVRLYTQNIDGLEDQCPKLPREKVVNVHGTMDQAECAICDAEIDFDSFCDQVQRQIKDLSGEDETAPQESSHIQCPGCGCATVKPAITLFRSSLPKRFFQLVLGDIEDIDLLIVMGTSLRVAPANTIVIRVPESAMRMVINRDPVGHHLGIEYGQDALRDYFAPGNIDPTVLDLMTHLGWLDDLAPLLEEDALPESSAELLRNRLEAHGGQTETA